MKLWCKFVRWLAAEELDAQAEFYHYQMRKYETSWRLTMEALKGERDAYKQRYDYILKLQADTLLLQPVKIIMEKSELGSSAAEVAAKGKDKEA